MKTGAYTPKSSFILTETSPGNRVTSVPEARSTALPSALNSISIRSASGAAVASWLTRMDALRCSSSSVFRTTDPCLDSFPVLAEKSSLRASAPLSLTVNQSGAESTFQLEIFVLVTVIVTSAPSFDTVSDFP